MVCRKGRTRCSALLHTPTQDSRGQDHDESRLPRRSHHGHTAPPSSVTDHSFSHSLCSLCDFVVQMLFSLRFSPTPFRSTPNRSISSSTTSPGLRYGPCPFVVSSRQPVPTVPLPITSPG